MKTGQTRRLLAGALWTLLLAAGLWGLDRLTLGPPTAEGWVQVAVVAEVPAAVGVVPVPPYLPQGMVWPPARVFVQREPRPGWWIELAPSAAGGARMWLGSLHSAPPEMPAEAASCFETGPGATCPSPWHLLSTSLGTLGEVHLLTTLEPSQARRVLAGLERRWGGAPSPSLEP